jgi:predicted RNA binding protein YcfA (HicA-like mRNA interferase family)
VAVGQTAHSGLSSVAVTKAARVLAALKRDGWVEKRRSGSHRVPAKGNRTRVWAYHDGVDLGKVALAKVAKDYGYEPSELGEL